MECPTHEILRRLCRGEIATDGEQSLVQHIEHCQSCQSAIDQLSGSFVDSAQTLNESEGHNDSQLLRERLATLKVQRPSPQGQNSRQFQDLSPWIDEGDSDIGRVAHYDLIRCLGRGGMGVVFEAFDRELQRPVAVKMMSPALLVDEDNSKRFLREARAAAAISHPSVVSIYAVSKIRDLPYLVMELVDGESLQERLRKTPKLDVETIIEFATQLADGLSAAHARGVVHRDVKPANILIQDDTESIKLTDFGLAYTVSENSLTQTGTLLGTPEYLAPEQIDGEPSDMRSDLFSLGTVIYHMGVGDPPFAGPSIVATLREVTTLEPVPLCRMNRKIPEWLSRLVEGLHAKDPKDRIADADSVAVALRSRGEQLPIQAANPPNRSTTFGLPLIATVVGTLAILAAVGFYVLRPGESDLLVAESADDLIEFLEELEGDLVIEVDADEPFILPPIELEERNVEIVAGDESDPMFIFRVSHDESAINCGGSQLTLVGIQIEVLEEGAEDEEADVEAAINCESGKLILNECEVKSSSRPCIALMASDCELTETSLRSDSQAIVFEPDDDNVIQIESAAIFGESGIGLSDDTIGTLNIVDTTFETNFAIELTYDPSSQRRVTINATRNRFVCEEALFAVYDVDANGFTLSPEVMRTRLPFTWNGSGNVMPRAAVGLYSEDEEREQFIGRID